MAINRRSSSLTRNGLGATLACLLFASSSEAQVMTGPLRSTSYSSAGTIQAGTGTCPDGSNPVELAEFDCFPNPNNNDQCDTTATLDWGVPVPQMLSVEKFDPSLGTLLRVELSAEVRFTGNLCVDNVQDTCCPVDIRPRVQMFLDANPSIPGVSTILVDQSITVFPPGFRLGNADGFNDCVAETGPPSLGDCVAGEDHALRDWSEMLMSGTTTLSAPGELAPWINTPGGAQEFVPFDAQSFGLFDGGGCTNLDFVIRTAAGVKLTANYVYCANMAPECVDVTPGYEVDENPVAANNSININLLDLVTDLDGCLDCSTFQITQQPMAAGPLSTSCTGGARSLGDLINPEAGCTACNSCIVTYTPTVGADFCGMDSFKFSVVDDGGAMVECEVFITVNPVNQPPECVPGQPDLASFLQGSTVARDFRPYVTDPDDGQNCGDGIDYSSMTLTSNCGMTFVPIAATPGAFRITAPADFCGSCEIEINVCDLGNPALCIDPPGPLCTVTVEVLPANQPPICVSGPALPSVDQGDTVRIDFRPYVMDPDDLDGCGFGLDAASISPSSLCGGSFVPAPGQPIGVFDFTAPADFCGPCQITVNACDLANPPLCIAPPGRPCPLTIEINAVNEPPVCVPGPALPSVEGGDTVRIDFRQYLSDPDDADGCGDGLDASSISPSSNCGGMFVPAPGQPVGVFDFTAPDDFCGSCQITVNACDLGSPPLCVRQPCPLLIEIDPGNERPVCVPGPALPDVNQGESIVIDFRPYVSDPDDADGCGFGIDFSSLDPQARCGTFTPSTPVGTFTFTASMDFCGPCDITLNVCDLATPPLCIDPPGDRCELTINVIGINQAPTCVTGPPLDCIPEDTSAIIDLRLYVEDVDDVTECGAGLDLGTFVPMADCGGTLEPVGGQPGRFLFTPPADYCGPCDITFTVEDGDGAGLVEGSCTIPLEICPTNDPPVARDDEAQTLPEKPVIIDLCANDSDPDDPTGCGCLLDCSTIEIIGGGVSDCGTLERVDPDNANGDFTWMFTPAPGVVDEICCFDYRIWDRDPETGQLCDFDEAEVCIFVGNDCIETNLREAASLLLYPEFDNREGMVSFHTVTNTSPGQSIQVKMEYVDGETCQASDRSVLLTPNDTFTYITGAYFADQVRGYGYMYTQCGQTGPPVAFNYLIGNQLVMDGYDIVSYGVNAIAFRAIEDPEAPFAYCGHRETDHNDNGIRDLDALEYDPVPDNILIPRFLGQSQDRQSHLILIALSGGKKFTTTLDFLIYNDNEEVFSSQHTFFCWERTPLLDVTNLFANSYLASATNDDPDEVLGDPSVESGWIWINGAVASSTSTDIEDPAFYAVLVESIGTSEAAQMSSDLPFGYCSQTNGGLLPKSLNGQF